MVIGVALFILCINISVFCIWIPARLQISQRYVDTLRHGADYLFVQRRADP